MVARLAYDLARTGLRIALQLWPLWLFWFALHAGSVLWRDLVLLPQPDRTRGYGGSWVTTV